MTIDGALVWGLSLAVLLALQWLVFRSRLKEQAAQLARASERRVRAITDALPARISHFDRHERVIFANRICGEVYGCDPQQLVGRTMREVRGEASYARIKPRIERVLRGEHVVFEHSMELPGGTRHFQQAFAPQLGEDGSVQGFFSVAVDITDRKAAEESLAVSEKSLRDIADNLPALIAYVDAELRLQFANATFERWTGVSAADAKGRKLADVLGQDAAAERRPKLLRALAGETVSFEAMFEAMGQRRDTYITYLPDRRPDGSVSGVYALINDISALKEVERRLDRLASSDPLTGLINRREFELRLSDAMARTRRSRSEMALLFMDIDHFKQINDRFGHAGGDAVLKHLADAMSASVRQSDTVARLAGDEFVVIVEGLRSADEAGRIAQKILASVARPVELDEGRAHSTSVSIGIAMYPGDATTATRLLANADQALYDAKAAGRGTWRMAAV